MSDAERIKKLEEQVDKLTKLVDKISKQATRNFAAMDKRIKKLESPSTPDNGSNPH